MSPKEVTRRQLLREAAGLAAAASAGAVVACSLDDAFPNAGGQWATSVDPLCAGGSEDGEAAETSTLGGGANTDSGPSTLTSTVVAVQASSSAMQNANGSVSIDAAVVQEMVDGALSSLAGDIENPWSVLLPDYKAGMRIGLKVNGLNPHLGTHAEVVSAVINSLATHLNVNPAEQVLVWEMYLDYMTRLPGYSSEAFGGAKIVGTLNSSTAQGGGGGPGYRQDPCANIPGLFSSSPRLSTILVDETDLTINMPVLKTHAAVSGVTGALKNSYGMIDTPSSYHIPFTAEALPAIYGMAPIRQSIRLTILDGLQAVINGQTSDFPNDLPKTLLMSRDPVALDAYVVDFINQRRAAAVPPYDPLDTTLLGWLPNAERLGLGTQNYQLLSLNV